MEEEDWGQHRVDPSKPNIARVNDFHLGGRHNFPADRDLAAQLVAAYPSLPDILRQNRVFLREAVLHMLAQGITQFLDLGAGLPTKGAVHEVAQTIEPSARVVYVDIDPVAILHTQHILSRNPRCTAVCADYTNMHAIFADPKTASLLDMSQPIGVLNLATLYFVEDDTQVRAMIRAIHDHVAPGSLYAVTHGSKDVKPEQGQRIEQLCHKTGIPLKLRTHQLIQQLIAPPFQILAPGLVPLDQWRLDTNLWPTQASNAYACIAIKPADPSGADTA